MIIKQEIELHNRASLKLMKHVAKEERDERRERLTRGGQLFFEKWNTERLSALFTQHYIPKVISETVSKMIAPSDDSEKETKEKKSTSTSFKSVLMDTIERLIPLVLKRVMV